MSTTNDIKLLLDIQDENMEIEENAVELKEYKGKTVKFITAKLTFTPTHCACCGAKNKDYTIYKNGTKTSRITLPMTGIHPTYLKLKKQRFFCKACNGTFSASASIVDDHCFISNQIKVKALIKSTDAQSLTDIAKDCFVSTTTIQRIINAEAKKLQKQYQSLPNHLSFDEFKYAKGQMSFEYINAETGEIIDMLDCRDARTIKEHFVSNYHLSDLRKVETITIDMNAGYVNVIKEIFPQAEIIIDRFHIVQLISRSMNKTRVQVMNGLKTSDNEDMKKYRRLKRYWKLLLKNEQELSHTEYKYYYMFGQRLEVNIVQELLTYDAGLKTNYRLYQTLLNSVKDKNFKAFSETLQTIQASTFSSYMKTSIKTLKQHLPYIENSLFYPYSNGRIEGINNKIKVLNRVAYGYRNFNNFKNRILLHFKLRDIINQKDTYHSVA